MCFVTAVSTKPNDTLQKEGLRVEVERDDSNFLLEPSGTWVSVIPLPSVVSKFRSALSDSETVTLFASHLLYSKLHLKCGEQIRDVFPHYFFL